MPNVTLSAMRNKVRQLSRTPSDNQLSNDEIDNYINLSILNDFPAHLKLFYLRKTFTFYTQPNIDTYTTNDLDATNPMYNFKNAILQASDPVYVGGYLSAFSQSRQQFFLWWPNIQLKSQFDTGDGATTDYEGTLSAIPVVPRNVMFSATDANGLSTALVDVPVFDPITGIQTQDGNLYNIEGPIPTTPPTVVDPLNTINYVTGVFTIDFTVAPAADAAIYAQTVQYSPSRPNSVLFFNDTFTLRPIPDGCYPVTIECQVPPTEMINAGDVPDINQWFEFIAYMAAKKVCEDRNDMDTIQILQPSLDEQKTLVERRTLFQQGDKRSATIYNMQTGLQGYWGPWWRGR